MSLLSNWIGKEADKLSTARINSFEGKPVAANDLSKLYTKAFELNGFKFLKIAVIGPLQVKTHDGCKVTFEIDNKELPEIESDSTDIKTDFSNTLSAGFTEFDIDLADELNSAILGASAAALSISFKDGFVKFLIPDTTLLKASLEIPVPTEIENTEEVREEGKEENKESEKSAPSE